MIDLKIDDKKLSTRLKKIPQYTEKTIKIYTKKVGNEIIREFKQGIKRDKLGLEKLNSLSVMMKGGIATPMYTHGGERSYSDLLYLRELKNGYIVAKSTKRHKNSKMRLIDLYMVHEYGAKIKITDKMRGWFAYNYGVHFKKTKTHIVIPARHAVKTAYENVIDRMRKNELSRELKTACTLYLNKADDLYFIKMNSKYGVNETNNR